VLAFCVAAKIPYPQQRAPESMRIVIERMASSRWSLAVGKDRQESRELGEAIKLAQKVI
jgi:hypothetical protein